MGYSGEKVFNGQRAIKYLFQKSRRSSLYLVVVFSGFARAGEPPRYTYIRSLANIDCNKLFILDEYGPRGCYYLGENKDFSVEKSVIALITHVAKENNISFDNIIAMGSSKGGYASLYFGIKYGFGYVIAGAPQVLLGDYLFNPNFINIADFVAGGKKPEHKEYLNSLLFDVIANSNSNTKIFIHLGKGDWHYKRHISPLVQKLEKKNISYTIDLGDYKDHGEIGTYFPVYFRGILRVILGIDKSRVDDLLDKVRNPTSSELGNMIVLAIRQPGRNTILLPYRLCRLLIKSLRKNHLQIHRQSRVQGH